jgi:hypothetical protein
LASVVRGGYANDVFSSPGSRISGTPRIYPGELACDHHVQAGKPAEYIVRSSSERTSEFKRVGHSGLHVPVLAFGTATFGGATEFFRDGLLIAVLLFLARPDCQILIRGSCRGR